MVYIKSFFVNFYFMALALRSLAPSPAGSTDGSPKSQGLSSEKPWLEMAGYSVMSLILDTRSKTVGKLISGVVVWVNSL